MAGEKRVSLVTTAPLPVGPRKSLATLLAALFLFMAPAASVKAASSQTPYTYYTVAAGDSLYLIAQKYKTTMDTLISSNNLTSTEIWVGQVLRVPQITDPSTADYYYRVRPGDSLYLIALRFGTTVSDLITANGLTSTTLLADQKLLLPQDSFYFEYIVQPGDSLYLISVALATTVEKIKSLNCLTSDMIYVGQALLLPRKTSTQPPTPPPAQDKPEICVMGFYTDKEGGLPSSAYSMNSNIESLSWVAPFWFRLDPGDAAAIEKATSLSDAEIKKMVSTAHSRQLLVAPIIYNFFYDDKSLTKNLVTWMISTPANRSRCISNIISLLQKYGFDGVNMDFEGVRVSDRGNLSLFYKELGDQLHARGYILSVDVPGKKSDNKYDDWTYPYDYQAIGQAADQVVLMMYNEHGFPGSGPGPVSSIGFNRSIVKYGLTQIAPQKVILAEPVFGFDFNLATGEYLYITHEMAMRRVRDYKAAPFFDQASQTPFFNYVDPSSGQKHQVWYENGESLKQKLDLILQNRLAGAALWRLGMEDPQIWTAIKEKVSAK